MGSLDALAMAVAPEPATLSQHGPKQLPEGADFERVYRHYEWGDAYTLDGRRRRFEEGPKQWAKSQAETAKAVETMKGD